MNKNNQNICIIGIDYSIISPGICIIKNDEFKWISIYSIDSNEHQKLLSKKDGAFNILDSSKSVSINLRHKTLKQGTTYSHTERNKLNSSIEEVDFIIQEIKNNLTNFIGEVFIAIEGISFGASGNTLLDICMSTGLMRAAIVTEILKGKFENFYVYSPGTIKKFAGKGTFKKNDMYEALISKVGVEDLELIKLMITYKSDWITPGGMVKPPVSDIVDATWIALMLKDVIEKGSAVEEDKSLKKIKKKQKSS